jgi:hypothetical protein
MHACPHKRYEGIVCNRCLLQSRLHLPDDVLVLASKVGPGIFIVWVGSCHRLTKVRQVAGQAKDFLMSIVGYLVCVEDVLRGIES